MAEVKMETQCLHRNYPGTQVIAAYVQEAEPGWWYFSILCDEEAEESWGSALSSSLSKRYASYDEAVLAMNEKLVRMLSNG